MLKGKFTGFWQEFSVVRVVCNDAAVSANDSLNCCQHSGVTVSMVVRIVVSTLSDL